MKTTITLIASSIVFVAFATAFGHILDEVPLIDGHNDLAYNLYDLVQNNLTNFHFENDLSQDEVWGTKNCNSCFTDLPRLRKGKVAAQFWAAYVSCDTQYKDALEKTVEQIDVIKRLVKKYPKDLIFATSALEIKNAFIKKRIASLIGVEGGHSVDSRLAALRMFYDLGVRYMTLTHTCNTPWADNSYVDDSNPVHNLTEFGKLVVKEMNRLGMMVDLSHVSYGVMNQAIEASRAPVIFSHSGSYDVRAHNRNVHKDTLLLLKENQGIVMVNFYPGFISSTPNNASIADVAAHINKIVDIAGIESVGIGGDYDGVTKAPKGLEDVSKYPDLFDFLESQNSTRWTKEALGMLAGNNFLRVFKAVENVRDNLINEEPYQFWIPNDDLNAVNDDLLWTCRTLLNNTSPQLPQCQHN
ncbi:hypothetical protein FQR65_LT10237 [Abscondita terminalis]|nr:hypothetical protein FQR65_LT10237 [Abscondita terminalis]